MIKTTLHEFPGREHLLEWLPEEEIPDEGALAARVLDALQTLGMVAQPLSADLSLLCCDPESRFGDEGLRPVEAFHHLRIEELPDTVHCAPLFNNTQLATAARLDRPALQNWIERALTQAECAEGRSAGWDSLFIEALRARIDGDALELDDRSGTVVQIPAQAGWIAGPHPAFSDQPPLSISAHNEGGALRLKINVHWSYWSDAQSPGTHALHEALNQLRAQGWQEVE